MIESALALIESTELPTWQEDAPLRRELLQLNDDVKAYHVASYDPEKAAKRAAVVNERVKRIQSFMRGHRCGTAARRFDEKWRMPK